MTSFYDEPRRLSAILRDLAKLLAHSERLRVVITTKGVNGESTSIFDHLPRSDQRVPDVPRSTRQDQPEEIGKE